MGKGQGNGRGMGNGKTWASATGIHRAQNQRYQEARSPSSDGDIEGVGTHPCHNHQSLRAWITGFGLICPLHCIPFCPHSTYQGKTKCPSNMGTSFALTSGLRNGKLCLPDLDDLPTRVSKLQPLSWFLLHCPRHICLSFGQAYAKSPQCHPKQIRVA